MLFSFDVEQMAASAQEKTPAGLTTYKLSLDVKGLSFSLTFPLVLLYLLRLSLWLLCCAELCLKLEILNRN